MHTILVHGSKGGCCSLEYSNLLNQHSKVTENVIRCILGLYNIIMKQWGYNRPIGSF